MLGRGGSDSCHPLMDAEATHGGMKQREALNCGGVFYHRSRDFQMHLCFGNGCFYVLGALKWAAKEHEDFACIPEKAWVLLQNAYGGGPIIKRYVVEVTSFVGLCNFARPMRLQNVVVMHVVKAKSKKMAPRVYVIST